MGEIQPLQYQRILGVFHYPRKNPYDLTDLTHKNLDYTQNES